MIRTSRSTKKGKQLNRRQGKKKYDKEITIFLAIYQTTCGSFQTGRFNILYRSSKRKRSDVDPPTFHYVKKTRCFRRGEKILGSYGGSPFVKKKSEQQKKKKMGGFLTEQSAVSDGDEFSWESLMIAEKRDALHQFQSVDDVAKDASEEGHVP